MMNTEGAPFTGVATALITPFADGEIDYPAMGGLIDRQIDAGIDALLVAGTTGESATLTEEEHFELIRFSAERIGGRVPLVAGCGSNSTAHAVRLAKNAVEAGADLLLAVTPYYNKASDRGLLLHFERLADEAGRPLILYNVPSRTGFHLSMEHYRRLADHPNIVGVKEASGDLGLLEQLCSECEGRLAVYTGNDAQIVPAMKLGAVGVISVCSNLIPRETGELCRLLAAGDFGAASALGRELLPRMRSLFDEVNPIPVKYAASLMGICRPEYRLPLCEPSPAVREKLERMWGR